MSFQKHSGKHTFSLRYLENTFERLIAPTYILNVKMNKSVLDFPFFKILNTSY